MPSTIVHDTTRWRETARVLRRALVTTTVVLCAAVATMSAGAAQTAPTLFLKPDCADAGGRQWTFTAFGTMPIANSVVRIVFDFAGQQPITVDGRTEPNSGRYSVTVAIPSRPQPPVEGYRVGAWMVPNQEGTFAEARFRVPCAPPPTTPTTSPPTAPPSTAPPTTAPPPQRTPTVLVDPALGAAGTVVTVRGFDFPAGLVTVHWDAGGLPGVIGVASVGADGGFDTQVLIFPNGSGGQRVLLATGGGTQAGAPFLIVPGTQQPARFVSRR